MIAVYKRIKRERITMSDEELENWVFAFNLMGAGYLPALITHDGYLSIDARLEHHLFSHEQGDNNP